MKKIEVTHSELHLGQFSFSKYDNSSWSNYNGYPYDTINDGYVIVTAPIIVDLPMYNHQLDLLVEALEKEINDGNFKPNLKGLTGISFEYNQYGNTLVAWHVEDYDDMEKAIELSEVIHEVLESILIDFYDMNDDGPDVDATEEECIQWLNFKFQTEKNLGYDLSDVEDLDWTEVPAEKIEEIRNLYV